MKVNITRLLQELKKISSPTASIALDIIINQHNEIQELKKKLESYSIMLVETDLEAIKDNGEQEDEILHLKQQLQHQSAELEFYKKEFIEMIESAKPLQCGGEYAHLLRLGDSIPAKAIPALLKEIERLKQYEPKFKIGKSAYWKICAKKIVICFIGDGCYLDQNYNFYPESDLFSTEAEALQSLEGGK